MQYLDILPKSLPQMTHKDFHAGNVGFDWGPFCQDLRQWLPKKLEDLIKMNKEASWLYAELFVNDETLKNVNDEE